jgi:hypothetical protein
MSSRVDSFQENMPTISIDDMSNATQERKIVLSFFLLPFATANPDSTIVALKLLFVDQSTMTVIMDRFACEVFRRQIEALNQANWDQANLPQSKPN